MSFGGFGGGGFGSSQNNQTTSAFGGFGQMSTSGGFGSTSTAFGAPSGSAGGLFGNNNNTGSTFGSGFGNTQSNSSPFGQSKPAFGAASSGGSLFGGGAATASASNTGFGGFGNAGSTGFGQSANTGSFGAASKPAFGASAGGSLFGGSTAASGTTGFGSAAPATSAFGSTSPFASNQQNNGTQNPQFTPFTEKEANTTNQYQTITAMPAYTKFQVEELRLVDYAQGRKYGNGSGQAGAFGASTGFGGFGTNQPAQATGFGATSSTGGGLFGNNSNSASTPFGGASSTTGGFGTSNNASGGLFGAKPAGTSLFGASATTTTPASGGLFGTSGGFGGATTTFGTTTSTPAFGQSQNKPLFGTGASTGFGGASNAGTSLFGNNANTGSAFGQTQQPAPAGGFSFGQQNNQQQQQQQQQTQSGGGLFGGFGNTNNQPKPGGLFGASTTTTGGLFGQQQQQPAQQQAGGLFGAPAQQQSGGLFGNKPASTGLFGAPAASNTGGGLFGSNTAVQQQPQQAASGGLFGSTNGQAGTSLFGAKPAATALGGSLFGQNANQQQPASGLFGASQQAAQGGTLGTSLFGSTNQQPLQQSQNNNLVASLNDNPYGNYQLFASLQTPTQSPGPLATPVGTAPSARKQAIIPHYRIVPHASSRLLTPQKRPQSYGFTYSNYNSPMSPASNLSPAGSLLGGSTMLGRSVAKSHSASNLRHSFSAQESILSPNAFSSSRSGQSNMKKLNINRGLSQRRSLFANEPSNQSLSKRVSFEQETPSNGTGQEISLALVRTEQNDESQRSISHEPAPPQDEAPTGRELAIVPENAAPAASAETTKLHTENKMARLMRRDQQAGAYTMDPSIDKLRSMSRQQRSAVKSLTVSREGIGKITFSQVDLTNVPLEQICGAIVELTTRQATVYGDNSPIRTPPQGQGLNVPSTIILENSWPRQKAGRINTPDRKSVAIEKHVRILAAAKDTQFVSYDEVTGKWTFRVEHYTTYGLEYDDDDDSAMTTTISHDEPNVGHRQVASSKTQFDKSPDIQQDESLTDSPGSAMDDTFDFKKPKNKHARGYFEPDIMDEDTIAEGEMQTAPLGSQPVLHEAMDFDPFLEAADLNSHQLLGEPATQWNVPRDLVGAVKPVAVGSSTVAEANIPTSPRAQQLWLGGDWAEHLQHTTSPIKRSRQPIKPDEQLIMQTQERTKTVNRRSSKKSGFGSTLDIMKSLFESRNSEPSKSTKAGSSRGDHVGNSQSSLLGTQHSLDHNIDSGLAQFGQSKILVPASIHYHRKHTTITASKTKSLSAPQAKSDSGIDLRKLAQLCDTRSAAGQHEQYTWELASILFGEDAPDKSLPHMENTARQAILQQMRKEKLAEFWRQLVHHESETAAQFGKSQEEKSLLQLLGGDVIEACGSLMGSSNFHLAQLVAQLPGDQSFRDAIDKQIEVWKKRTDWSEMSEAVRAIYEVLGGNVCECRGLSITGQENKATTFKFSTRYRFDWRRAFGLRLWFGILKSESIADAVDLYLQDLLAYKEAAIPSSWFLLRLEDQGWTDPDPNSREDILWSLLKLFANAQAKVAGKSSMSCDLAAMFAPESVSGHPLDARLSFELLSSLMVSKHASLDHKEAAKVLDRLALTYADVLDAQIEAHPEYLTIAIWVLLHLSSQATRSEHVQSLLEKHAQLLDPTTAISQSLTAEDGLQIPYDWICSALAKHAQTVLNDPIKQARWLIEGGELQQAHDVVCRNIGPGAVISLEYEPLREVLSALDATDVQRKVDWDTGAGLYVDFLELADLQGTAEHGEYRSRVKQLVKKLASSLEALAAHVQSEGVSRYERIALKLMAETVLDVTQREKIPMPGTSLTLPLTESGYLKQSMAASVSFYHALALKA